MDPDLPDLQIADVVVSLAGRDKDKMYYVIKTDDTFLYLADGRGHTLEKPKRKKPKHAVKVLRSETRVAVKLLAGDKVLNSELRRDLAYLAKLQSNNLGG